MGAGNRSVEEPKTLQVLRQEVFRAQPLQAAEGCHATGDSQEKGEKRGKWKQLPTSEKYDYRCSLFHGRNPQHSGDIRCISRRMVQVQRHQGRCVDTFSSVQLVPVPPYLPIPPRKKRQEGDGYLIDQEPVQTGSPHRPGARADWHLTQTGSPRRLGACPSWNGPF